MAKITMNPLFQYFIELNAFAKRAYLKRDLKMIDGISMKHPDFREYLPKWLCERLTVIQK